MISDEEAEKAVDFIRDNARKSAQATANRIYMTEYRKVVKAQIMRTSAGASVAAQEVEAESSAPYIEHLKALREAVEADEYFSWMMTAAEAKIEAWRTHQANQRALGKI